MNSGKRDGIPSIGMPELSRAELISTGLLREETQKSSE
jgi:hypothetical protein